MKTFQTLAHPRAGQHSSPGILLAALAMATIVALAPPVARAQAPAVPVLAVQAGVPGSAVSLEGTLQPVRQATVAAQVPGTVLALSVKAGESVRAGQVLARLDTRDADTGVQRAAAALAQAQAEAANAQTHVQRTRELRAQGFVSQAALDVAETQFKAAQAGVQAAQAANAQAALARGFAAVAAPFDGVVLATHLDAGDLAAPGRPILTLYAPGALRAEVQVPASRAAQARAATQVRVVLPDGREVEPARRQLLAGADPVAQTIEWRLDLPASALEGLLPGQRVTAHFSGPSEPAAPSASVPRVPQAAVLRRGELTAVYVARGDAFVLRAVRLGSDRGAEGVEVLAGLRADELVAANALQAGLAGARPAR
jgi:RND family efflux transporter MFP subunit